MLKAKKPDTEWQRSYRFFKARLTDGSFGWREHLMRRRIDGAWEYRRMTEGEFEDWAKSWPRTQS